MGGKSETDLDCAKIQVPVYSPSSPHDNDEADGSNDKCDSVAECDNFVYPAFSLARMHEYFA
jgi:hypothetical protein